jgi:hypothetical protein
MARQRPVTAIVSVLVLVGLVVAAAWFTRTPYWALYRLHRAVAEHDLGSFRHFADTEAIVHNAVDTLMDDASTMVWGHPLADDVWRGIGRRLTDDSLDALRPQLHRLAVAAVEEQLQQRWLALTDSGRNAPYVELVSVNWRGAVATVTIKLTGAETPVGFTMTTADDGSWRVVTLDAAFMKQLIRLARQSGSEGE